MTVILGLEKIGHLVQKLKYWGSQTDRQTNTAILYAYSVFRRVRKFAECEY
jgi:hypothetical protein